MAIFDELFGGAGFYLGMSGLICLTGALTFGRIYSRQIAGASATRQITNFLAAACVCGSTIWTTQAVAWTGLFPTFPNVFAAEGFVQSLLAAFGISTIAVVITRTTRTAAAPWVGGAVLGLCSAMTLLAALAAASSTSLPAPGLMPGLLGGAVVITFSALGLSQFGPRSSFSREIFAAGFIVIGNSGLFLIVTAHLSGLEIASGTRESPGTFDTGFPPQIVLVILFLLASVSAVHASGIDRRFDDTMSYGHAVLQDALTGLPNRTHLETHIEPALTEAIDAGNRSAVIFLSLSRFNAVRDLHGLSGTDAILAQFSKRLSAILAPAEYICRFGDESFVAVKNAVVSDDEARSFAEKLRASAADPIRYNDLQVRLRANLGLAVCPDDGWDLNCLIHRASLAAKQANQNGPNQIRTFNPGLEVADRRQICLVADLRSALAENRLHMVFQAHMRTRDRSITGYEALVRWQHPKAGVINACNFIPIAEKSGLIVEIGEWGLREACKQAAGWPSNFNLSINASPLQLARPEYPAVMEQILRDTGLCASRVEIELTETSTIDDPAWVLATIRKLRDMGITMVMDDFGTGYSSLNTLQEFPFDKIKIDRVFTNSIETDPISRAIIRSAVLLGHGFKIPVVAEGVENEVQFRFVKEAGCTEVQGFYFGQAVQASEILDLLQPASRICGHHSETSAKAAM